MPLTPDLRLLAGEAALQMIIKGEARAAATARRSNGDQGTLRRLQQSSGTEESPVLAESDEILQRAARGMVQLHVYCSELESYAKDREAWANDEVRRLEADARRFEQVSVDIERNMRDVESRIAVMNRRIETADQSAAEDRAVLKLLQERVAGAFGSGSETFGAIADLGFSPRM